jgi:hypothetical protein
MSPQDPVNGLADDCAYESLTVFKPSTPIIKANKRRMVLDVMLTVIDIDFILSSVI